MNDPHFLQPQVRQTLIPKRPPSSGRSGRFAAQQLPEKSPAAAAAQAISDLGFTFEFGDGGLKV